HNGLSVSRVVDILLHIGLVVLALLGLLKFLDLEHKIKAVLQLSGGEGSEGIVLLFTNSIYNNRLYQHILIAEAWDAGGLYQLCLYGGLILMLFATVLDHLAALDYTFSCLHQRSVHNKCYKTLDPLRMSKYILEGYGYYKYIIALGKSKKICIGDGVGFNKKMLLIYSMVKRHEGN
ncbi:hypothetical protein ACJX0J_020494, partial [Zea mays]